MTEEVNSPYEVKVFEAKIGCAKKALEEAVVRMGKGVVGDNWTSCCDEAIVFAKCISGTEYPTNEDTIRCWNMEFCSRGMFLRNDSRSKKTEVPLSRMLINF